MRYDGMNNRVIKKFLSIAVDERMRVSFQTTTSGAMILLAQIASIIDNFRDSCVSCGV